MILKYNKIIFSDYRLNNELFKGYENSEFTYLKFGRSEINQEINLLPPNITHLTFSNDFNQKVDNLPPNLTQLTFGYKFNKEVYNIQPNVSYLKIECNN